MFANDGMTVTCAGPYSATVFYDSSRQRVEQWQLFQNFSSAVFGSAGLDVFVFPSRSSQASFLLFGRTGSIACRNEGAFPKSGISPWAGARQIPEPWVLHNAIARKKRSFWLLSNPFLGRFHLQHPGTRMSSDSLRKRGKSNLFASWMPAPSGASIPSFSQDSLVWISRA